MSRRRAREQSVVTEPAAEQTAPAASSAAGTAGRTRTRRRVHGAQQQAVVTSFGTIPAACTHWRIRRRMPDGSYSDWLTAPDSTGDVHVRKWPIADLSADTVLVRWGEGSYAAEFLGPRKDAKCAHVAWGEPFSVRVPRATAPEAPPPPVATPPGAIGVPTGGELGGLGSAMHLFAFIQQSAAQSTQNIIALSTALMQAARPPDNATAPMVQMLVAQQRQTAQQNAAILEALGRLGGAGDDDDDDDDDDAGEDGEEAAPHAGGPFTPGVPITDAAKTAALNALWAKAPEIAEVITTLLANAASKGSSPRLNGAANGASAASSAPTTPAASPATT